MSSVFKPTIENKATSVTTHCGAKRLEILAIFRVFLGRKPPYIHGLAWNLAGRRGPLRRAKFHVNPWIVSPLRGEKKLKIACWVIEIRAVARSVIKQLKSQLQHRLWRTLTQSIAMITLLAEYIRGSVMWDSMCVYPSFSSPAFSSQPHSRAVTYRYISYFNRKQHY